MCTRFSFILTRVGKNGGPGEVLDGFGITHSHTAIRELHGMKNTDDTVNAYEWQPPKGWPDADWMDGLTKDLEIFEPKKSHLSSMERHIRTVYPTMMEWDAPDVIRIPKSITVLNCDLVVVDGQSVDLPYVTEVAGSIDVRQDATFTAPVLAEVSGNVDVQQGATFTAPVLSKAGYVDVQQGATFTAPVLDEVAGNVDVQQGATFTAPVLAEVAGNVDVQQDATFTAPKLRR